jgi:predicted phosphodiesterase
MKLALISDIHANLPALEAVLAEVEATEGIQAIYHLGDLVGYAPWPDETVALIRKAGIPGVAGNYDSTTATGYEHCGCRYEDPAQEALSHLSYAWTLEHTSAETKGWLGSLPFRLDVRPLGGHRAGPTLFLVHGAPTLNTLYWTEDRSDDFCLKMAERVGARGGDLIAFGHTHHPWHRVVEGIHFLNTGSVGRPKDEDWRAGYVVVTVEEGVGKEATASGSGDRPAATSGGGDGSRLGAAGGTEEGSDAGTEGGSSARPHGGPISVEFIRVEYDLERARAGILASTLPDAFAEYLATGGNPRPGVTPD